MGWLRQPMDLYFFHFFNRLFIKNPALVYIQAFFITIAIVCGKYAQNVVTQAQWHCVLTGTEKSCVGRKQHLQGKVVFASRQKQSATFLIHVTSQSAKEMTAKLKIQEIIKNTF